MPPMSFGCTSHGTLPGDTATQIASPSSRRPRGRVRRSPRGSTFSTKIAAAMMTIQTGDFLIVNRGPGWAFGYGGSILTDPKAALTPQSSGTFGWGGVWGHSWFTDPAMRLSVVSLTNTALEGMMGRYIRELRDAIYADIV